MIPRIVHQTWKTRDPDYWVFRRSQKSVSEYLQGWEYRFWTDEDLDQLVRGDFSEFYTQWLGLNMPIKRVDTARYCMLYKYGGLYADLDFIFTKPLEQLFDDAHDLYFYRSRQAEVKGWTFLGNALMMSEPLQEFWLGALRWMMGLPACTPVLDHTGPRALGAYFASLREKPRAKIFGPDIFDNDRCVEGVGEKAYGYHVRTGTWQRKANHPVNAASKPAS